MRRVVWCVPCCVLRVPCCSVCCVVCCVLRAMRLSAGQAASRAGAVPQWDATHKLDSFGPVENLMAVCHV